MIRGFIPLPVFLAILAVIYWRIVSAFRPLRNRRILLAGALGLIPLYFLALGLIDSLSFIPILLYVNGFLMGFLLVSTIPVSVELFISLVWPRYRKIFVSLALCLSMGLTGWGMVNGLSVPTAKQLDLQLDDWPPELAGLRIAFLADLHMGTVVPVEWLEKTVARVNKENPDLIVIAGDLIGGLGTGIQRFSPGLRKLRAPLGVWVSRGNHEFDNSGRTFRKLLQGTNIQVLENRNVVLPNGLQLAGVDDPRGEDSPDKPGGADVEKALDGLDPGKPVLLLSHRPAVFNRIPGGWRVVQLSGHTHAGQFPPLSWCARLMEHYHRGLFKRGSSRLLVTPGTGTWEYLPLRIASRNSILSLTFSYAKLNLLHD